MKNLNFQILLGIWIQMKLKYFRLVLFNASV